MLTIITPTYNRGGFLERIYACLLKQTCGDFEWIVVDDGSTDNTHEELEKLQNRSDRSFNMEFYLKSNGGKHTALNYALPYIKGELSLILDSDDLLTEDAVETVLSVWQKYKNDDKICGLSFLRGKSAEQGLASFPKDEFRSNHIDFRINKNIKGDCCEVLRSDILKEYPFPVFEGEKFVGENVLWVRIALKYDTIYIKKVIYLCEYLEGGLTKSGRKLRINNPLGGMESSRVELNKRINLKRRIKSAILYSCYGFKAGKKRREILKTSGHAFLVCLCMPFGRYFYKRWSK